MSVKMLKLAEVAEVANVSPYSVRRQIKCGFGPPVTKIGRVWRFRADAVEAWLERCTVRQPEPVQNAA